MSICDEMRYTAHRTMKPIRRTARVGLCLFFSLSFLLSVNAPTARAQSPCGPSLIEADEQLSKGLFRDLEQKLQPCWHPTTPRAERVEAHRILALAHMAGERYDLAQQQAERLLALNPDYAASLLDSPKFAKLLGSVRSTWLDPTRQAVVTATKSEQNIGEAPAVISLISARQIETYGYRDVGEALSSVSGLDVLTDHVQYNLGVRGINAGMRGGSRIVKVMIENQPVSYRPSSENFLGEELIPIQAIERIEVVRGPSSALYGANAYLGVVNIIARSGEHVDGMQLTSRFGLIQNNPAYHIGLLLGKKTGRIDYLVAASGSATDRSGLRARDLPGKSRYGDLDITSRNDLARPTSLFARAIYERPGIDKLSFDINWQRLDSFGEFQDWGVLTGQNRIHIDNAYTRARYERQLRETLSASFSTTYARGGPTDSEFLTINQRGVGDWITRDVGYTAFDLGSELSYASTSGNQLRAGVDFSRDAQELQTFFRHYFDREKQATGFVQGDTSFVNSGVYLQSVLYPFRPLSIPSLSRLGLTSGVRFDSHNIYGNITNWRFAGAYPFTRDWYAKVLYGTSFKEPSPTQLFTTLIVPQGVLGNPDLKPEKARTWEVAFGGRLLENLAVTLVGFTTQVQNNIRLVPSGANTKADNVAEISSYGFEQEFFYNSQRTSAYLNLSHEKSEQKRVDRLRGVLEGDTHLYPGFMAKFGAMHRPASTPFEIGIEGRFIGERTASEQNVNNYDPINLQGYRLDSHWLVDLVCSRYILISGNRGALQFTVRNLFNQTHYFPGYRDFDIPSLGRSTTVSLTYHL
ncbi:MAG: outer membrane receptor for ferrienterochelin and colicins [Candidatus Latescibacterota bacterium]|jgi:outer membrane receptor for ferrienterochelin and colicins